MKTFLAIVIGFFLGLLIYMELGMVFSDIKSGGGPSGLFVFVTFVGGWILTSFLVRRRAQSFSKIFSRGFLLGATLWLLMIIVGLVFSGKAVTSMDASSTAEQAGAAIGGGLVAFLTGGVSIVMVIVCLIGFAVSFLMGREMKAEEKENTKKCPQCAEMIKPEAKKCRFCGADI